ncbi:hypothetical protein D3C75_632170 [compost metagenome]
MPNTYLVKDEQSSRVGGRLEPYLYLVTPMRLLACWMTRSAMAEACPDGAGVGAGLEVPESPNRI